ncbi:MAG: hypothetical protein QXE31_05120 [Candidatus Woesearchaeota archaeon]
MEDESLYNAMIIALIIGIFVVILSLIFLRPEPEYFTELYYTNHKSLPFSVKPNQEYFFNITIANHEKNDTYYNLKIILEYETASENKSETIYQENVFVKKEEYKNLTLSYKIPEVKKVKVKTTVEQTKNDSLQDIHFFVYNEDIVFKYPDYIALIDCVPKINLTGLLAINASGNDSNLKIRKNGIEIFNKTLNEPELINTNITIEEYDLIDIVFDNDFKNETLDRNLYINYIIIGDEKIYANKLIADIGKEKESVDCEKTKIVYSLPWNAALRFRA